MKVAGLVAEAMKHDPWWPPDSMDEGIDASEDRARALDEFERVSDLQLPEVYRYLAMEHPRFSAGIRLFSDIDKKAKMPVGPFVLGDVAVSTRVLAKDWADGTYTRPRLLGRSQAGAVVDEWIPLLFPLFHSEGVVMLDFRFDPVEPPVVVVRQEAGWDDQPPRASTVFVADDLLSLLRLELQTEENYEDTPADAPTERCVKWTEWRNSELLPRVSVVEAPDSMTS